MEASSVKPKVTCDFEVRCFDVELLLPLAGAHMDRYLQPQAFALFLPKYSLLESIFSFILESILTQICSNDLLYLPEVVYTG